MDGDGVLGMFDDRAVYLEEREAIVEASDVEEVGLHGEGPRLRQCGSPTLHMRVPPEGGKGDIHMSKKKIGEVCVSLNRFLERVRRGL